MAACLMGRHLSIPTSSLRNTGLPYLATTWGMKQYSTHQSSFHCTQILTLPGPHANPQDPTPSPLGHKKFSCFSENRIPLPLRKLPELRKASLSYKEGKRFWNLETLKNKDLLLSCLNTYTLCVCVCVYVHAQAQIPTISLLQSPAPPFCSRSPPC